MEKNKFYLRKQNLLCTQYIQKLKRRKKSDFFSLSWEVQMNLSVLFINDFYEAIKAVKMVIVFADK